MFVPWTKTDQLGEGTYRYISGETWGHLRRWRDRSEADTRNDRLFEENDLVFRTMRGKRTVDNTAMSRQAIWRLVKSTARELRLDPAGFSAHSTRVGTAQDMLEADIGILAVMDAGGWKTPAMPQHYARAISATESGAASWHVVEADKLRAETAARKWGISLCRNTSGIIGAFWDSRSRANLEGWTIARSGVCDPHCGSVVND